MAKINLDKSNGVKRLADDRITAAKETPPPQPQLTADGYTKRGGSPSRYMIQVDGGKRWRRIYILQFSNAGSCIVKMAGADHFLNVYRIQELLSIGGRDDGEN